MAGVGTSEVIEVSQEQVKRAMPKFDPTLYTQKPPDEEEVAHPHPHPNPIPSPNPNPIPNPSPNPDQLVRAEPWEASEAADAAMAAAEVQGDIDIGVI